MQVADPADAGTSILASAPEERTQDGGLTGGNWSKPSTQLDSRRRQRHCDAPCSVWVAPSRAAVLNAALNQKHLCCDSAEVRRDSGRSCEAAYCLITLPRFQLQAIELAAHSLNPGK